MDNKQRLFITQKGQPFWVDYDPGTDTYTHADTLLTLAQVMQVFDAELIRERRFLFKGKHIWLPFRKDQCKAFFRNKFLTLDVLRRLDCIEAPVVQKLRSKATVGHAPGAASLEKYSNRSTYKGKHTRKASY